MKQSILKQIEKLHTEEKHAEIIKLLENSNEPLDYELTCLLARAYCNMPVMADDDNKYINKGLSILLSVKDMGENDPLWHYRAGFAYFYADKEEEALEHFKKAVELIPKTTENAAKWRDFNIGYFIGECEDIIKAKQIKEKFGTGENASEKETLDFILFNLLHRSLPQEDIVTDNSIYVPEWMLLIRPVIIAFDNEKIEIEWNITCPVFDNSIKELTFGAGENLHEAVFIAVGTFTASLLQTIKSILSKTPAKLTYSSEFNKHYHNWNVYYNPLLVARDEMQSGRLDDLIFWNQIENILHKYLGNQKSVCVKIYAAKFAGNIISECCIDDIYINELSNIIGDYIDNSLNIQDHFYTIRQYIILTQHEDTMLPYKYEGKEGYVELKNNLKKICNVIYNLKPFDEEEHEDAEDAFFYLIDKLDDAVNDFTLCIESLIFIPEIFAANLYEGIAFPENIVIYMQDEEEPVSINYTQFADYSRIYRAVWEIFDGYEDTEKRDIIYNKFISMSFSINSIIAEGKKIEDLEDSDEIMIPVFEVNADERFEIR